MDDTRYLEHEQLHTPPIIEAVFQIKWEVSKRGDAFLQESFKFFPALFAQKMKERYPEIEFLPAINIPDEFEPYLPRYRFRKTPNGYPLVQVGPGVLTVNIDKSFSQRLFHDTCVEILTIQQAVLPDVRANELSIHYIDGFDFNFESNPFDYLAEKFHARFDFSAGLFETTSIRSIPLRFTLDASYRVERPQGAFTCRLRDGVRRADNQKMLLMDSIFSSCDGEVPDQAGIPGWIQGADDFIHKWFFKMIEKSGIT